MTFGELKRILSNDFDIDIFDENGCLVQMYNPDSMDDAYDNCKVYKLGISDNHFVVHVEMPTWRVTGTITIDIEFDVKALDEDSALDYADFIHADTDYGHLHVTTWGDEIDPITLGNPDFEWDGAETYE